jgi:hypothetical protein
MCVMFDLALFHLTHDDRQRDAAADLRRRQLAKTAELPSRREPRPAVPPQPRRFGADARLAER